MTAVCNAVKGDPDHLLNKIKTQENRLVPSCSAGKKTENNIVTLNPQKELPVHVSFTPSSMGLISSSLVIKSLAGKTNSKVIY